jgi:predicted acylesterase/phospholipase RssA
MSTTEALQAYDECAAAIFSGQNRKWSLSHRFRATALEKVVQGIVESRGMGDEMWDPAKPEKGKAIVCVMPSDAIEDPRMVRSFRDPNVEHPWDEGVKIWEAARATTAAPSFFKGQKLGKGPDARTYIDAAIGANNPVEYLLKEAADEFGSGRRLGCVVSIGTGTRSLQLNGLPTLRETLAYYGGLFKALKSTATDCEETHRQLQSRLRPFPGSYFRFNVPKAAEEVKLHEYKKMPQLKASTAKYLATEAVSMQIEQVADGLRADAFDHGLTLGHVCKRSSR